MSWQPGDPLYTRPKPGTGSQHIRPLLEVLELEAREYTIRREAGFCPTCEVSSARSRCWFCGAQLTDQVA